MYPRGHGSAFGIVYRHGGTHMVTERVRDIVERQGYNVSESARIVGVGRTTMHKMIREGRIRPIKIGARTIIPRSEIDRILRGGGDERAA